MAHFPAETRHAFFASLADVDHRRREPWIIEGRSYLNHPLRAAASARYVQPALDWLEEIQKTGDIFFPKNWMDATLSGSQSREAAETVPAFLAERPDYLVRLRRIIPQRRTTSSGPRASRRTPIPDCHPAASSTKIQKSEEPWSDRSSRNVCTERFVVIR